MTAQPFDLSHNGSISTLVKRNRCHLYVFAGSKSKFSDVVQFSITGEFSQQEIEVLDENRSIKLEDGRFQDSFGAYATHLYKIPVNRENCV
ncbi:MAG: hypothetical protein K9G33_02455 [Sneathiella sp.]|nr:hypothetical protein [Sneathiella sp.]